MSYTPTEWKSGDVVTSTKLNKMEAGIASNVTFAGTTIDDGNAVSVLTVAELWAASQNGVVVLVLPETETFGQRVLMTSAKRDYDSHDEVYEYNFEFGGGYFMTDASGDEDAHMIVRFDDGSGT